jgi:hypothetical protein
VQKWNARIIRASQRLLTYAVPHNDLNYDLESSLHFASRNLVINETSGNESSGWIRFNIQPEEKNIQLREEGITSYLTFSKFNDTPMVE